MSGASSRRKGHDFERAVARAFRGALGTEARRGFQSRDGAEAPDVIVPGLPLWPELKRGKRTNIKAALRQAQDAAPDDRWPIAICRDDREEATATMLLSDYLELLSAWLNAEQPVLQEVPYE